MTDWTDLSFSDLLGQPEERCLTIKQPGTYLLQCASGTREVYFEEGETLPWPDGHFKMVFLEAKDRTQG